MNPAFRDKVKPLAPGAFEEMSRAAEAVIENVRGMFLSEARSDLDRMRVLLGGAASARPAGWQDDAYRIAHNLKGQGSTFGYDLVTRIAHALCGHLRTESDTSARDKKALAHCESLRVILDKDIRGMGDEYGARLLQILGITA